MKKICTMLLVVLTLMNLVSCSQQLVWPDSNLGKMIPQIDGATGEISHEDLDSLRITLEEISTDQYLAYIAACKEKGFNVDIKEKSGSYIAFNKSGYKIDVSCFSTGDMWITVDAPILMSTFDWPNSDIAELLPKPDSNYGKIEWEADYGFVIYVGNTTKADYKEYVDSVYALGFTVGYNKGDDYFYADNADGYSVSLKYEGFNIMFVRIDDPEEDDSKTTTEDNSGDSSNDDEDNSKDNNGSGSSEMVNGVRLKFKEAMDSYEAFFDEFCTFMKKYNSSSNPSSMLNDYLQFMSQYTETMNKLNEIGEEEMNTAELLYYTEAMARINQKLLEIT